ncbi:MAG: HypC/HybG/HupF family hydrogenase formation chaperone [Desulfobacterium sp.]|jgi:hydrogenase expression/formation protein HypC|nr:HypC/HybG/HupF family hydrogenase formation chaperone [Desulfobacterium sp.]
MCLAIPSKIIRIVGDMGTVDVDGVKRDVSLLMIEEPQLGDYVIVHAGFAIHKIDEITAKETLQLLKEALAFVEKDDISN